jgi:hypothetical protein
VSLDAQGMLEVNRTLIFEAARSSVLGGSSVPLVVSMAVWGRGCSPAALERLQPFSRNLGYNGSLVTTPPPEVVREVLGKSWSAELEESRPGRFPAIGVALGETVWEWWNLDGTVEPEERENLF